MMRTTWSVLLAVAAMAVSVGAVQRETRAQHVLVAVTKNGDAPVTGLTTKDFIVREDDVAREIMSVGPAAPPSHIALLVDDSSAAQNLIQELRSGVHGFLKRAFALSPAPEVALTTFGERPTAVVPFSTSSAPLEHAADRLVPKTGSGSYFLEAIQETVGQLGARDAKTPVIVAFVIDDGPELSTILHDQISDELKKVHASLWVLELQSQDDPNATPEGRERSQVVGDVARSTGGVNVAILNKQGIDGGFNRLQQAMAGRYDVEYARPDSMIPPTRISVSVRDRALHVVAPVWIAP
jgi:hypothetical protein